jgi:hypothetical protein
MGVNNTIVFYKKKEKDYWIDENLINKKFIVKIFLQKKV